MSDFWIGFLIIAACLYVFAKMCVVVAEGYRKRMREELDQSKDLNIAEIKDAADMMRKFSKTLTKEDEDTKMKRAISDMVEVKLIKLTRAIDCEDYESAAVLRDDINRLNEELKQYRYEDSL